MHPHIWYPFTQAKISPPPLKVISARGIWLELEDGRKIMDCISSWWVNLHGHSHPKIAEAIYRQAIELEQVIFAGFTHQPAEKLAQELVKKLPDGLSRVFYSDNGSTAVEVALKMVYQYWVNQNQQRQKFIAFQGAYHGDTFGAMSVGSRSLFSQVFSDMLFEVDFLPFPETYIGDTSIEEREEAVLTLFKEKLTQNPQEYAGIIIEPLVQGAGGMRMCRVEFLQKLQQVVKQFDTLLIFDEVMTGFGRTGEWFACLKSQVTPDVICLSKGITGGFLPLSVTVCSDKIYDTFYSDDPIKTLYHGHSYTANPLGCAAALASWELMNENQVVFNSMEAKHLQYLEVLHGNSKVEKLRVTGTIAAMEIVNTQESGYLNQVGLEIREKALEKGLLLRPLGNVLYIMPPYCITDEELSEVYDSILSILKSI
ncbi:adenosylmethionine--8-amino-7-oxononanoate transaminase [Plectonema cf. radiosum LEGE 06105]|uniref:Adenosylmethionine-8-amino-7-oxononanoate aminotransferase n=1 Tax=Plectonema cf. radiosum LEGE 06105 TaxID=945769 RepID=A0A8J7JZ86_9CYAN|nr:adenosylmethionine--8-amino-7-oxononanoate transaminase [Plectonema radiosum]MBE9212047.1 adenosylmethionine--8-amino-7-oxononanoate transaminase [Plectonema cf. radiosum LEGE 06105]